MLATLACLDVIATKTCFATVDDDVLIIRLCRESGIVVGHARHCWCLLDKTKKWQWPYPTIHIWTQQSISPVIWKILPYPLFMRISCCLGCWCLVDVARKMEWPLTISDNPYLKQAIHISENYIENWCNILHGSQCSLTNLAIHIKPSNPYPKKWISVNHEMGILGLFLQSDLIKVCKSLFFLPTILPQSLSCRHRTIVAA